MEDIPQEKGEPTVNMIDGTVTAAKYTSVFLTCICFTFLASEKQGWSFVNATAGENDIIYMFDLWTLTQTIDSVTKQ